MKKSWIITIVLFLLLAVAASWVAGALTHDLVVLRSGEIIYVDGVWMSDASVFFTVDNDMDFRDSGQVREIVVTSMSNPASWVSALSHHAAATVRWLQAPDPVVLKAAMNKAVAVGPWLLALAMLFSVIVFGGKQFGRRPKSAKKNTKDTPRETENDGLLPQLAGLKDVAALFSEIYRLQLKAPADAPVRIVPVSKKGNKEVLELKIKQNDKWHSRRMTLSPIGENTGSKSQCYYVIYDTHIVVKVPPKPITRFDDYLAHLRAEARIKQRLSPKECVIPNLSVILKKIHPFPDAGEKDPEALDERYIIWLEENPDFRNCLKLRGGFVFFMDLARYIFVGNVLSFFHDTGDELEDIVRSDTDILHNFSMFEDKYGEETERIYNDLLRACENFQQEMAGVMVESDEPIDVTARSVREWMLFTMAGLEADLHKDVSSERLKQTIRQRLSKTEALHRESARKYQAMVHRRQAPTHLRRTRPLMGEMATNLLVLLSWLSENKVALRDLKPDNLLVAGNPDEYPNFLTSAKQYAIGLIDLETAVDYGSRYPGDIPQPQLGGTPLYATPSHFFQSALLKEIHGDLDRVFRFQDWYAITAIIYEMVIGECLFPRTARQFAALMHNLQGAMDRGENLTKAYLSMSARFWDISATEFASALELNGTPLEKVFAGVPESVRNILHESTRLEKTKAWEQAENCLDANAVLSRGSNRKRLVRCSAAQVYQIRRKYAENEKTAGLLPVLNRLIVVKKNAERLEALDNLLSRPFPKIPVKDLLERMYTVTKNGLRPDASVLAGLEIQQLPAPEDDSAIREALRGETIRGANREGLGYTITTELS